MHKTKGIGGQFSLMLLMGFVTNTVVAGNGDDSNAHPWKDMSTVPLYSYVATISAGPVWANGANAQTFYLQPDILKTFTGNRTNTVLGYGELFLGIQRTVMAPFDGQLGIAVATTGNAKLSGNVWDDGVPQFNNFIYSYNVRHTHVAVMGKLLRDANSLDPWLSGIKPYLSGSLGVGFNRATSFSLTPTIFEAVPFPTFTTNSTTTFTYTVGAGIQREITNNWQAGIGYEFADWGKNQLGAAPGQTIGSGLLMNHLYTNGLMFNLTYLT